MQGVRSCSNIGLWKISLCMAGLLVVACQNIACDNEVRQPQNCQRLEDDAQRRICEQFAESLDEVEASGDAERHLVLQSFCDGHRERVAVAVANPRKAMAEAVERRFGPETPGDGCVFAVELLTARSGEMMWDRAAEDDLYAPHRHGLQIRDEPFELVTPLDFASVRPRSSRKSLTRLPHLYRHALRDSSYLDLATDVKLFDAQTYVWRDGQVDEARFHRFRHTDGQTDPKQGLSDEALVDGIRRAADWFETMRFEEKSRFYYEYNPYRDHHVEGSYNLLRHAGSTWSIVQAYGLTGDEAYRRLAEYALEWVEGKSRTEEREGRTIRYVVEPWNRKAKLGGAGLWLLALSEHARLTGDTDNLELMQQIANHIYLAQDPESGQFESFHEGPGLAESDHVSDYYPGEAMFALHRARPFLSDVPVCEITQKGLAHMLEDEPREMRADRYRFVNQWNAYTIREYRRDCDDGQFDWVWERDLEHMLTTTSTFEKAPVMAGAYISNDGAVNTSPTRLEALTLICTELGAEDTEVAERCDPVIRRVAGMQLSLQHGPANSWLWSNPEATHGGFPREMDRETIRIDFTQHHLSAMYNAVEFLRHVSPTGPENDKDELADRRDWPFNLVGEATCDQLDGAKCL